MAHQQYQQHYLLVGLGKTGNTALGAGAAVLYCIGKVVLLAATTTNGSVPHNSFDRDLARPRRRDGCYLNELG